MGKEFYERKVLEILNDANTYQEIDESQDRKIINKIKQLIEKDGKDLTTSEKQYLFNFDFKTSQFYGLPKVHKSKEIIDKIKEAQSEYVTILEPRDLKLRPIVAGPTCPTHRLSSLLDILLKAFIKHVKSYVRDDIDFLNHLPGTIDSHEIFVSFDVSNLYSSITHELGLTAIEYFLETHPEDIHERFSKSFILKAIKLVLENNTFQFGSRFFRQILGTAMGTKFAPNYATLVLGFLEHKMYNSLLENYGATLSLNICSNFKRYLDDCFIIWDNRWADITDFHGTLNALDPQINYTIEIGENELPFLDILVKREGSNIITDIYHKPTDTKQYLHFKSCHPRHVKSNIPYNLARRVCSIIQNENLRTLRLNELKTALLKREYPLQLIEHGITKAKNLDMQTLRSPKEQTNKDNITFIETYNPNHQSISQISRTAFLYFKQVQK